METIEVKRGGQTVCNVYFGSDLLGAVPYIMGEAFLVYDAATSDHVKKLAKHCQFVSTYCLKNVSEPNKTLSAVEEICRWLLHKGANRDALLVAVGGGIVSDIAGFAASMYKRGIRSAYIPTTVLAQVDAAIGGKTGVNLDSYKNIIGAFHQPEFVYMCTEVLKTLPLNVFRSGLSEIVKAFIISGSQEMMDKLTRVVTVWSEAARGDFCSIVYEAVKIKVDVVARDEFEAGERRKLNLGHTFAHAIEHKSWDISHAEAVSMGIAMAARASVRLKMCEPKVETDIVNVLQLCGLPTVYPFPIESLVDAISKDKKAEDGAVNFVLIRSIGDVVIRKMTVDELLRVML